MNKWALITGASSGIGYDLAKQLDTEGYNTVLVARNLDKLESLKKELKNKCFILSLDLSNQNSDELVYSFCKSNDIEIDLLVNNAGFGDYFAFKDINEKKLKDMINLNCLSLISITRKFVPSMIERKSGHIVQMASIAGFMPGPLSSAYYASKAFVINISLALQEELKEYGIDVTIICPGPVKTNFQKVSGATGEKYKTSSHITESKELAEFTLKMIRKKKKICIYPKKYKIMIFFIVRILPINLVLKIIKKVQINKIKYYNA